MRNPHSFLSALSLGLGTTSVMVLSACGNTAPPDPPVHDLPGITLLDTGDDGNNEPMPDPQAPAGFNTYGFWYSYDDIGSCMGNDDPNLDTTATVVPAVGSNLTTVPYSAVPGMTAPSETLPNATPNTHGIRVTGGGQEYFGAALGFKFKNAYTDDVAMDPAVNPGINLVTGKVAGFRFWAFSPVEAGYIAKMQDFYSTPQAGQCVPRGDAPACVGDQNCENAPAATFNLAAGQWTLVEVYLNAVTEVKEGPAQVYGPLARSNWAGVLKDGREVKTVASDPTHVYQFQIQTASAPGADGTFDLWIDNFGFIEAGGVADKSK